MLTKPEAGWSDFSLDGTSVYHLSYLDNIPFEWLDEAIHGLETLNPFCVKGFMEPDRFICVVSFWNCHIICEDEDRDPLDPQDTIHEISHTSMLQFCQQFYDDISVFQNFILRVYGDTPIGLIVQKKAVPGFLSYRRVQKFISPQNVLPSTFFNIAPQTGKTTPVGRIPQNAEKQLRSVKNTAFFVQRKVPAVGNQFFLQEFHLEYQ